MRLLGRVLLGFWFLAGNLSCTVNILETFADKNTPEALYETAKKQINDGNYAGALETIGKITGSLASHRKVTALKASAHAGLCGLEFLPLVEALPDLSNQRLFPLLMSIFRSGDDTDKIDNCIAAEEILESIGDANARTSDENLFLVLVAFAKIGVTLSYYADADQDGTVTNNYDICAAGATRTAGGDMPDSDVAEIGWSLVSAINNITAVSSSVDVGDDSLDAIQDACSVLGGFNPAFDFCAAASKEDLAADPFMLLGIRSLIKEDSVIGLDTLQAGCDGDVTTCHCP